jgi:putative aldouronate transport system substrate-binding protein
MVCVGYGAGDWAGEGLLPGERTDFVPLPVIKGPNVEKPVWQRNTYGNDVLRTQVAITDKADNLPTIIRWFDHVLSEEISIQINNGPLGVTIEKIGDKKYRRIDTSGMSEEESKKYEWGNLFPQSHPKFIPFDVEVLPAEDAPEEYDEKGLVDSMYEPYLNERTPQVWISEEDAKRVSVLETDISNYINDRIANWVSGQADIDAEWDEYKAQLEKLGLNELIEIRTKAVEAAQKSSN